MTASAQLASPPVTLTGRRLHPSYRHHPAVEYGLWLAWTLVRYTGLGVILGAVHGQLRRLRRHIQPASAAVRRVINHILDNCPADWRAFTAAGLGVAVAADITWLVLR